MEFVGREAAGVVSVACSSSSHTSFATLSAHGTLTLWDLRLRRRNYLSVDNPNAAARTEASELCYFQDRHAAVALCGNAVQLFDTRKSVSVVAEYVHPKECVAFLKTPPPSDAATTLLVDEDGGMFPFNLADGTRTDVMEAYVLGRPCALPTGEDVLGHLSNYCSGLHCIDVSSGGGGSTEVSSRVLLAVGMDGSGALYAGTEDKDHIPNNTTRTIERVPFSVMEAPQKHQTAQVVNPPLVNCTAVCRSALAVGRADSTYTVYHVRRDGPEALFEAPGHAVNGLCYVDWLSPDVLITTSLCGEVTGWNVGGFLAAEDEEEEEGDLPEVVTAFSHREVPGCQLATVNCGDRLGEHSYVFGDHMGGVTLARVEL
ncbi:hypothetical protein ABB37_01460 [Leptomonas pyrrhocoris]|uniref:Guanine nucleotide-binding protein subunit beta-like protein n=1 Tax=Leptomonas pyrrhocoris TaxID=157538 RepID=A0A0M9G928_LEPPY|nr:hypothetical protein ABB37_01460 [Leptomonas pyrrhocoris]KPA85039.1 hypothetical protein ABB37_01460 [Leptomonas pyrrhocoris]|eukprot:XP_015663478.1 hypothetical protein ABB37_01460 [Leptomonas pyrrhocoris]